jgi:hypothetical protein
MIDFKAVNNAPGLQKPVNLLLVVKIETQCYIYEVNSFND